jgi:hypothetical protein
MGAPPCVTCNSTEDVAFTLEDDSYAAARGLPAWGAVLRDMRPAGAAHVAEVAPLELKGMESA